MNIFVCVKQVPDDYAEIRLGGDGKPPPPRRGGRPPPPRHGEV